MIYKNCPFILSCAVELRNMPIKNQQEQAAVTAIRTDDTVKELIPKLPPGKTPGNLKSLCVIIAYMLRMSEIEQGLLEDLEYILGKAPYLMEQMLQMAMVLAMEFKFGRSRRRITARNVLTLITFSQNLVQGLWIDDDPFLQLPGFTDESVKAMRKKHKNITLEQYCMMGKEQRREMTIYENDKLFEESENVIRCFPCIDVKIEYYVEGEKEIAVGDILTIKLTIDTKQLQADEQLGFVHSNHFPFLKQSSWFLIFTDAEELDFMAMEKLVFREKVFTKEIKERLSRPGKMQFFMILRNDSYRGFDKKVAVQIDVLKEANRTPVEYNEEDVQAAKAPSMMQAMMEMDADNSDDDESEDEATAAAKQSANPTQASP